MDRYLIIGVDEDKINKTFTVCGTNVVIDESEIQQLLQNYIDPFPQIEIISGFPYRDVKLDIIKIKKENKDKPYLFKKNIEVNRNIVECRLMGYIRHGSSSTQLTRNDLTEIYYNKKTNIYSFFDISNQIDDDYFKEIMMFLESMDYVINKESMDVISKSNNIFKKRILEVFQELVSKGNIFKETPDLVRNDFICNLIFENKQDFSKLHPYMDGGEHALIVIVFVASYLVYLLKQDDYFKYDYLGDKIRISFEGEQIKIVKERYDQIDRIIKDYQSILNYYSEIKQFYYYVDLFRLKEVFFSEDINNIFLNSDIRFKVSENIIPLLLEPLYQQQNLKHVAVRELLQNAVDACKKAVENSSLGEVRIEISQAENREYLTVTDNGIGMNFKDISEFYLTVGRSSKTTDDPEMGLVGKFGIGVLTMFLIGDRCDITTKKQNDYEYNFKILKEENRLTSLKRIASQNSQDSFTRICVELRNPLRSKGIRELLVELGLNNYVVNSQMTIKLEYKGEEYLIPCLDMGSEVFKQITGENQSYRLWMVREKLVPNGGNDNLSLNRILGKTNKVLYNNIISDVEYNGIKYKQLNKNKIPFFIVDGKIEEDQYKIELSRGKVHLNFPGTLERLRDAGKLYTIYSNSLKDEFMKYPNDYYYCLKALNSAKTYIADIIDKGDVIAISKRYLIKYIVGANDANYGFRQATLKIILRDILPGADWEVGYAELWNKINENRMVI